MVIFCYFCLFLATFWLLLATFNYFLLLLATFGYFWLFLAFFGHFLLLLANFGSYFVIFGTLDYFYLLLGTFGYFWILLETFGYKKVMDDGWWMMDDGRWLMAEGCLTHSRFFLILKVLQMNNMTPKTILGFIFCPKASKKSHKMSQSVLKPHKRTQNVPKL